MLEVYFLGHILSNERIFVDHSKVRVVP